MRETSLWFIRLQSYFKEKHFKPMTMWHTDRLIIKVRLNSLEKKQTPFQLWRTPNQKRSIPPFPFSLYHANFGEESFQSEAQYVKSWYVHLSEWTIYFVLIYPVKKSSLSDVRCCLSNGLWPYVQYPCFGACISACPALSCLKEVKMAEASLRNLNIADENMIFN